MDLDRFLDEFFSNFLDNEDINNIKKVIKNSMGEKEYKRAKVEFQVFTEEENYTPQVSINSEGYNDGEVIFIDCYIEG